MTDTTVTLRLTANASGVVTGVKLASGELDKLGVAANKSGEHASRGLGKTRVGLESISNQLARVRREVVSAVAAFASIQGVRAVARMADEWANVSAQQRLATRGSVDQAEAMEQVYAVAQRTSTGVSTTGNLVARLTRNIAAMGVESKAAFGASLALSETINQTFAISGASASAQANAITQFTQALAGGVLRAEEFNSIVENSPRLAQALADGMGVGMGKLRELVNEGKIQSAEMLKAIQSQASVLDREFAQLPLTIERAWIKLQNSVLRYIGTADQANSVSAKVARGIEWVAKNIDSIANAVVLMGKVVATVYAAQLIHSGLAWIANLNLQTTAVRGLMVANSQWAASTVGSFSAAIKQVGLLGTAFNLLGSAVVGWSIGSYLRDEFLEVRLFGIALVEGLLKLWENLKAGWMLVWETMKFAAQAALNGVRSLLADFVSNYARAAGVIPDVLGGGAIADQLRSLEQAIRPTGNALDDYAAAVANIAEQHETATRQIEETMSDMVDYEIETDLAAKAAKSAAVATDDFGTAVNGLGNNAALAAEEIKRLAVAQASFARENDRLAAALDGEWAVAQHEYAVAVDEANAAHKRGEASASELQRRLDLLGQQYARTTEQIREAQYAPQALLDTMSGELRLLGLTGIEREKHSRRLRAEQDMRGAINEATRAGANITADMTDQLVHQARAFADLSLVVEDHAASLGEWADVAVRGVSDFADLFANVLSGMRDGSKSVWDDIKGIFRSGWRDSIRTLLDQSVVRPLQNALQNLIGGAFNGATAGGNWMQQLFGMGQGLTSTGASAAGGGWMGMATAAGSLMGFGNNVGGFASASAGGAGGGGAGSLVQIAPGIFKMLGGGISGGMIAGASYLAGAGGALYGWKNGGDTAGKVGGAAAYGAAGYYGATAVGTVAAGYATGGLAGAAAAGTAALDAILVAGWVALAAIAVDKISGGKLFGTDYKAKEVTQEIAFNAAGGTASASVYEEGKKSLFRGTKRRTRSVDAGDEARTAADDLYDAIDGVARSAAEALGLASVDVIAGSFKQVSDAKGNLTREFSTVLGQVYTESIEAFQQRLSGENIIAQISQLDDTASAIAQRWRSSAADLLDGAQFLLAAASDFNSGSGLLVEGGLSRMTDLIEALARGGESLSDAYQRVMSTAMSYGATAASAYQDVATAGFSNFAKSLLQVRQEEKERTRALREQARALGGLSAREVDLAKVREAAQLKTDALVRSLESELVDLALNRINDQIQQLGGVADGASSKIADFINSLRLSDELSPDTDATKRVTANDLMNTAALAGDIDAFTQYAQQFLEVSRRLNASAAGYQADYDRVLQLAGQFGSGGNVASLAELYAQRSVLQAQQEAAARLERAQRIAQGVSDLAGVRGGDPLEILRNVTGLSPEALAGDLGLSVTELGDYLARQQTDIGDLADILYELPRRIATELVSVLADRELPVPTFGSGGSGGSTGSALAPAPGAPAAGGGGVDYELLLQISNGIQRLVRIEENKELLDL